MPAAVWAGLEDGAFIDSIWRLSDPYVHETLASKEPEWHPSSAMWHLLERQIRIY